MGSRTCQWSAAGWVCSFADLGWTLTYLWSSWADMALVHMVSHPLAGQPFVPRLEAEIPREQKGAKPLRA